MVGKAASGMYFFFSIKKEFFSSNCFLFAIDLHSALWGKNWFSYMYTYIYFDGFIGFYIQTEISIMYFENKLVKYRNIITEHWDSTKSILSLFCLFSSEVFYFYG